MKLIESQDALAAAIGRVRNADEIAHLLARMMQDVMTTSAITQDTWDQMFDVAIDAEQAPTPATAEGL